MSSFMLADMCARLCLGPIIDESTKWMPVLHFYSSSDTEHYKFKKLHEFEVN